MRLSAAAPAPDGGTDNDYSSQHGDDCCRDGLEPHASERSNHRVVTVLII